MTNIEHLIHIIERVIKDESKDKTITYAKRVYLEGASFVLKYIKQELKEGIYELNSQIKIDDNLTTK